MDIKKISLIVTGLLAICFVFIVIHTYSFNLETELNSCLENICKNNGCGLDLYPRNAEDIKLFGLYDAVLEENSWLCERLPIKLRLFPDNADNMELIYVSEIYENSDNGKKCEFVVTEYGFFYTKFEIQLECSSNYDYEFL